MKALIISTIVVFFYLNNNFTLAFEEHYFIYSWLFYLVLALLININKRLAIPDFIALSSHLVYLVVPAIMFDSGAQEVLPPAIFGYDIIAVKPEVYYRFAIAANILFYIAINIYKGSLSITTLRTTVERINSTYDSFKVFIVFIVISFISSVLNGLIPSLNFFFFLGSQLSALTMILSLFTENKKEELLYFFSGFFVLTLSTARTGMFGEMLYMLIFYFLFRGVLKGYSVWLRITAPILSLIGISFLTVFKMVYRTITWSGESSGGISTFYETSVSLIKSFNVDYILLGINSTLYRLNQAYLSSLTMTHVPYKTPFANGQTIIDAIVSFVPRIFWPGKPPLSGSSLMIKYTGYKPLGSTSMSIGQLGESYANFGIQGGVIFYFFYGAFISFLLHKMIKNNSNPLFLLFIPLVVYYAIKSETIFSKVFNYGFKGVIFSLIIIFILNRTARRV